ncbi:MAG: hypothetical protein AAFY20_12165 [Cyanobacteria bacterium J06639_14]
MKKITQESDVPNIFFIESLPVYRGVVERKEIIQKPDDLKAINGRKIFALKEGGKISNSKDYEELFVDLEEVEAAPASNRLLNPPKITQTKSFIKNKRQQLLEHREYTFHYLNHERVLDRFNRLKYECKVNDDGSETSTEIIHLEEQDDPKATNRFALYLNNLLGDDLTEGDRATLDLECTRERSQKLSNFDVHVEAIKNEGYIFEESQLDAIRSNLEFEDRVGILAYLKTLPDRPVIMSTSFKVETLNVQLNDNESGHYNVYFKHTDSDLVGLDVLISTVVPRKDIAPELRPLYDSAEMQPFDAVIVGNVIRRPDLFTNRGYDLYITPIAIYS